jgi:hypothetical protein
MSNAPLSVTLQDDDVPGDKTWLTTATKLFEVRHLLVPTPSALFPHIRPLFRHILGAILRYFGLFWAILAEFGRKSHFRHLLLNYLSTPGYEQK